MKTTITYNKFGDYKTGTDNCVVELCNITRNTYINSLDKTSIDENLLKIGSCISRIQAECGYRVVYSEKSLREFLNNIVDNDLETLSYSFETEYPTIFVRVIDMNGLIKWEFQNNKNEVLFFQVGSVVNEVIITEANNHLSKYVGFNTEIDYEHFKTRCARKDTHFELRYEKEIYDDDSELVNPVNIKIGYDNKKKKYVLMYKSCSQMVDYISIHHSKRNEGLDKLKSVLDSFKNRIKILGNEEVDIGKQKYIYDTIVKFNVMMVEKSYLPHSNFPGAPIPQNTFKNFNIKPTTNILNLDLLEI